MHWKKNQMGWYVPKFPYFNLFVYNPVEGKYTIQRSSEEFNTLKEAKEASIEVVKQQLQDINYVCLKYTQYPGNTGEGIYIGLGIWRKYHWLEGGVVQTSQIFKRHRIRFDITVSKAEVLYHAERIHQKHKKKFFKCLGVVKYTVITEWMNAEYECTFIYAKATEKEIKELEETRSFEDVKLLNSEISKAFLNQQEYVEHESWRSIRVIEK